MRFLILNQYQPPDPAPTARLFGEISDALIAAGHSVAFASGESTYTGRANSRGRFIREGVALLGVLFKGCTARRPDVVIAGSSPPCLLVFGALVACWHGVPLVHWAMDLYPELAVALGEVRSPWIAQLFGVLMKWAYGQSRTVVTLDEDMARVLSGYGVNAKIISPWVVVDRADIHRVWTEGRELEKTAGLQSKVWRWAYCGNLGRAHEWRTLLKAQAILESRGGDFELVFQGGGSEWENAQSLALDLGLKRCLWTSYVPEARLKGVLLGFDCLVATQLEEVRGFLWPSKLSLLLSLPRPLLWIGPRGGSCSELLSKVPHAGCFGVGDAEGVAAWLAEMREKAGTSEPFWNAAEVRSRALEEWMQILAEVRQRPEVPGVGVALSEEGGWIRH
jgi:colanic acid biosynthesis glycosyl transferase WcaI